MSLKPKKVSEIKKIQEKMYSKTREDLFDVLSEKGSLEDAKNVHEKCIRNFWMQKYQVCLQWFLQPEYLNLLKSLKDI